MQWCGELIMNKLIKPSTGLAIITSDPSAAVISQIIDANPDIIFLKPFTLNILKRHFDEYFTFRQVFSPYSKKSNMSKMIALKRNKPHRPNAYSVAPLKKVSTRSVFKSVIVF